MLKEEVATQVSSLRAALAAAGRLRVTLDSLADVDPPILEAVKALASGTDNSQIVNLAQQLRNQVAAQVKALKQVKPRPIFRDIESLQRAVLAYLPPTSPSDSKPSGALFIALQEFSDCYEAHIQDATPANAVALFGAARRMRGVLDIVDGILEPLSLALQPTELPAGTDTSMLVVRLYVSHDFDVLAAKIMALDRLYRECVILLGQSPDEHPAQVVQLEAGSFVAKIAGMAGAISLTRGMIEAGARFLYRRFTKEGRIASIPRDVHAIEAVLNLRGHMKAAGLDVTGMEPNLTASAEALSRNLNTLLGGEPSVTVDDERISVGAAEAEYIAESRQKLLSSGSEEPPDVT